MRSTASRAPARSEWLSAPGAPPSVTTLRLWSGSEWMSSSRAPPAAKASAISATATASLPSETLGTANNKGSEHVRAGVEDLRPADRQRGIGDDDVQMHRH